MGITKENRILTEREKIQDARIDALERRVRDQEVYLRALTAVLHAHGILDASPVFGEHETNGTDD